jgi:acyl transferase domain-containing protein
VVAGAIELEDALEAVWGHARRAEALLPPGRMTALMKPGAEPWFGDGDGVWIASRNFPGHFVITGRPDEVKRREQEAEGRGFSACPLPVRYAFHSPDAQLMEVGFRAVLEGLRWSAPRLPLWSAALGWHRAGWTPQELWHGIGGRIAFARRLGEIEAEGAWNYLDAGPSGTSATFVKYNLPPGAASRPFTVMSPFGGELAKLDQTIAAIV